MADLSAKFKTEMFFFFFPFFQVLQVPLENPVHLVPQASTAHLVGRETLDPQGHLVSNVIKIKQISKKSSLIMFLFSFS